MDNHGTVDNPAWTSTVFNALMRYFRSRVFRSALLTLNTWKLREIFVEGLSKQISVSGVLCPLGVTQAW